MLTTPLGSEFRAYSKDLVNGGYHQYHNLQNKLTLSQWGGGEWDGWVNGTGEGLSTALGTQ